MIEKIISGGQTGVDRAALDAAIKLGIPHGGWCPRGRLAEDGCISRQYHLQCPIDENENAEKDIYAERTKLNVRDSDATLILMSVVPLPVSITSGTNLTLQEVKAKSKPYFVVDLSGESNPDLVVRWINGYGIKVLNVAGPRESQSPGIYDLSLKFLEQFLSVLK